MSPIQTLIAIVGLVTQLLPTLIDAVKAVEAALPQSGQGAAKLALVQGWMKTAFNALQGASVTFDQVWPALQSTIEQLVKIYNTLGEFKKA